MRVLHIHSGNLYGGVETILTTLARRADACPELQHEFALCFEGRLSRELADMGATAHPLASVRVSRPVSVIRSRRQLQRLLSEKRFEALVFHSAWSHAIFAPVAGPRVCRLSFGCMAQPAAGTGPNDGLGECGRPSSFATVTSLPPEQRRYTRKWRYASCIVQWNWILQTVVRQIVILCGGN